MESDRHRTGFRIDDILRREDVIKDDANFLISDRLASIPMDFGCGEHNFTDNTLKWSKPDNYSYEELILPQGSYYQNPNPLYKSSLHAYSSPFGIYPSQQYSDFYTHPYLPYFLPPPGFVLSGYQSRRKGGQIRFTADQTKCLENKFENIKYLSSDDRRLLAVELKLSDRQVKTWFQNRRAKWRRYCNGCLPSVDNDSQQEGSRVCEELFERSSDVKKSDEDSKNHESIQN